MSVAYAHYVDFEVVEPIRYEKKGLDFTLELVWITVRICVYPFHTQKYFKDCHPKKEI